MSVATVTEIYTYPIKSCAPIALDTVLCQRDGLPFDRNFVITTDAADKILTQRDLPKLSLIRPIFLDENTLGLSASNESDIVVPNTDSGELLKINVWGNDYLGVDQGAEIDAWLSRVIGVSCRLLKRADNARTSEQLHQDEQRFTAAFVDCCPLSIVFEDELETLNAKLTMPVPVSRFRPSIVVRGFASRNYRSTASADPQKLSVQINGLNLNYIRPVGRCVIINIDQENGVLENSEPLKVLASYNRVNNKAALGHYYVSEKSGRISIGDVVSASIMTSA